MTGDTPAPSDHKALAEEWLAVAGTWFRDEDDTEAPQVAQAAALIALTHAVLALSSTANRPS